MFWNRNEKKRKEKKKKRKKKKRETMSFECSECFTNYWRQPKTVIVVLEIQGLGQFLPRNSGMEG